MTWSIFMQSINNIIFDVGNVLVKWSPSEIIRLTFGSSCDVSQLSEDVFQTQIWTDLNLGKLTEDEAKEQYKKHLSIDDIQVNNLFNFIKTTQSPIDGTEKILKRLHDQNYSLFALTDNVKEIVVYLKDRYDFWRYFKGIVVSAEVQLKKPGKDIFNHLLETHNIHASKTIFIDDHRPNIDGAKSIGLQTIHFNDAIQCEKELKDFGLTF